jgi:hypothetical protein
VHRREKVAVVVRYIHAATSNRRMALKKWIVGEEVLMLNDWNSQFFLTRKEEKAVRHICQKRISGIKALSVRYNYGNQHKKEDK